MAVLFLTQVFNVDLAAAQIFTVIGILMITSKGAAVSPVVALLYWLLPFLP